VGIYEQDQDKLSITDYAKAETFDDAAQLFAFLGSERFRAGRWVFRGHADADWSLCPTLERFAASINELPRAVETYVEREFRRRAHHYVVDTPGIGDSRLDWLALMRHHQAPSRLLDCTRSPYVAAFFASAEASLKGSAAIWAFDCQALKHSAAVLLCDQSMSVAKKEVGRRCLSGGESFSDPEIFSIITADGPDARVVVPVERFRTNERMLLQRGIFLCPNSFFVKFEHSLKNVVRAAKQDPNNKSEVLYKITVSPRAHPHTLRELHRMNITYATLFPGLDGLAQSLTTVCRIRATTVPATHRPDYEFEVEL
jgi:hypothetical protein